MAVTRLSLPERPPHLLLWLGMNQTPIDTRNLSKKLRDRGQLAELREQIRRDRAEQADMATLIGQSAPKEFDASWLMQRAHALRDKQKEFVETLRPVIRDLKNLLNSEQALEPEVAKLVHVSVEILEAYPPLYRDLSKSLLKQAAERRRAAPKALRARPVKGRIDYEQLSREHIRRYPKIRARLAE